MEIKLKNGTYYIIQVDREILFDKMEKMGIGGKFLSLLEDYYDGDFIKFDIGVLMQKHKINIK